MTLASDRSQAKVIFSYIEALIDSVPMLKKEIELDSKGKEKRGREWIHLKSGVSIEVHTSNYRSVRGRTVAACVLDEVAFWKDRAHGTSPQEGGQERLRNRLMVSFTDEELRMLERRAGGEPLASVLREIVLRSLKRGK